MNPIREYTPQTVLASMQAVVVIAGSMFTGAAMKIMGYPEASHDWHLASVFVRNWGVLLILIPATWVVGSIWMERNQSDWFSKRWTVLSGLLVLLSLAYFLYGTTVNPAEYRRSSRPTSLTP